MPLLVTALLAFVTNLSAQAPSDADVRARATAVLASIRSRDFASIEAQFDDAMKAALPPGRLESGWTSLVAQLGPLKECGNVRVRAIAGKQMVIHGCDFERGALDFQVAFDGAGKISGIAFRPAAASAVPYTPPPYATPSAYTERDVTVGAAGWPLPGTLTMPRGDGPFPVLVLVHGSGPGDRDETVGANKPFADLALGLASRGLAVLRYEKRTRALPSRLAGSITMTVKDETVDDAVAAAAFLRTQPNIDPSRVFVLGHSLGGMLIPRIAAADSRLAGVVVMAGAARPIEQAIVEQTKYLANADGVVTPQEQAQIDEMMKVAATVASLTAADAAAGTRVFNAPAGYWLDLRGYDAPAAAKAVKVPMLVLQGERDYQVTMEEFGRWKAALSGRTDVTFRSYPALNHLFLPGTGKSLPAEYDQPSHVAAQVVDDIASWVKR